MKLLIEANLVSDLSMLDLNSDLSATHLAELDTRSSEMSELKSQRSDTEPTSSRHSFIVGAVAAVAVVVIGAFILLQTRNESPVADQPATPVETARAFVEAYRGSFDVDEAFTYLADDPENLGFGPLAEERLLARFLEATGSKLVNLQCEERGDSPDGSVVRCTYQTHEFFSDDLGLGPYGPSWGDYTIVDGMIVSADQGFDEGSNFSNQIWEPFAAWIGENHPDDRALIYGPDGGWNITEESIPVWEQRLRAYVEEVTGEETAEDTATGLGVFEPVRGRVVFRVETHLEAVDPDDPSSSNVIEFPEGIASTYLMPAGWSADGSKLALGDEYNGYSYVMDETGTVERIAGPGGCCAFVDSGWMSPDGTQRLGGFGPDNKLYIFDLDDTAPSRTVEVEHFEIASGGDIQPPTAVWSPDGGRVAYIWSKGGDRNAPAVGIVDLSSGASRELTSGWAYIRHIAWSPDDSQLLIIARREAPPPYSYGPSLNPLVNPQRASLYLVDIDDGEAHEIAEGHYVAAAFSPDGTRIAAIDYPGSRDVVVMNADGSGLRTLANLHDAEGRGSDGWLFTGVVWHPVPAP
jgi:hypothetical protein